MQNESAQERTAAVVVTYHPNAGVVENLHILRPQVDLLLVVDNGSSSEELAMLRSAAASASFELIENGANLGSASALNIGVRRAVEQSAEWIFLFDQDSQVTASFTCSMRKAFTSSPWGSRLALLTPQYTDRALGISMPATRLRHGIETAITSGSLLRAETFRRHGLFRDEMFIDGVDHEYSLRLRRAGLILEETTEATLLHSPGELTAHNHLGKAFLASNYSPIRRYYQERNKIWLARHYATHFPSFIAKQFIVSLKDLSKIALVEDNKAPKLRYFLRGILDGLRNRMGPLNP